MRSLLGATAPEISERVDVVASIHALPLSPTFDWVGRGRPLDVTRYSDTIVQLARRGARLLGADPLALFGRVLTVTVDDGELVIAPHEAPEFVVVAAGPGLVAAPLGGFDSETGRARR